MDLQLRAEGNGDASDKLRRAMRGAGGSRRPAAAGSNKVASTSQAVAGKVITLPSTERPEHGVSTQCPFAWQASGAAAKKAPLENKQDKKKKKPVAGAPAR